MRFTTPLFLLLVVTATSFDVLADKVYKTTNEKGTVEFSDKKTPGAEKIKVKPNVVDLDIPKSPESTAAEKPEQASDKADDQLEEGRKGTAKAGNLRRKIRYSADGEAIDNAKEKHDKAKKKRPVTIQPVKTPAAKPVTKGSGGRAGGGR